jgi:hypothetical protein
MEELDISTDEKIFQLKGKIEKRKKEIEVLNKPSWKTNCILDLMGKKHNLHVIGLEECHLLLSFLLSLNDCSQKAADLLGIETPNSLSGFSLLDWIHDLVTRGKLLANKESEKKLREIEKKLDSLLSEGAKKEIELKEISDLLSGI